MMDDSATLSIVVWVLPQRKRLRWLITSCQEGESRLRPRETIAVREPETNGWFSWALKMLPALSARQPIYAGLTVGRSLAPNLHSQPGFANNLCGRENGCPRPTLLSHRRSE